MSDTVKPDTTSAVDDSVVETAASADEPNGQDTVEVLSGTVETAEEIAEEMADSSNNEDSLSVKELQKQVEWLQSQLQDTQDQLVRQQADIDNTRKRMQREVEDAHKFGLKNFAVELLPVKDSMELHDAELSNADKNQDEAVNLSNLQEGSTLILKILTTAMDKFNIEEINPMGEKFNPELHQAMSMMPSPDAEPNTVLIVHQKGYQLNGRLLRPALVIVSAE